MGDLAIRGERMEAVSARRKQEQTCENCGLVWAERRVKDDHPGVGFAHVCPRCGGISEQGNKKLVALNEEANVQAQAEALAQALEAEPEADPRA